MNSMGATPGNEPVSASHTKNMPKQPGMPDRGRFVLVAFKHLPGTDMVAMREFMLMRITDENVPKLMLKGFMVLGMIWLKPYTDMRMICRYEDPWRSQVMGMFHFGVINNWEWWPLN
jgi:hypothetical protein